MGITLDSLPVSKVTTMSRCAINDILNIVCMYNVHWTTGKSGYREFIKAVKETLYTHPGTLFLISGSCSYKGAIILQRILQHIKSYDCVQTVTLQFSNSHSNYNLTIKVKDI